MEQMLYKLKMSFYDPFLLHGNFPVVTPLAWAAGSATGNRGLVHNKISSTSMLSDCHVTLKFQCTQSWLMVCQLCIQYIQFTYSKLRFVWRVVGSRSTCTRWRELGARISWHTLPTNHLIQDRISTWVCCIGLTIKLKTTILNWVEMSSWFKIIILRWIDNPMQQTQVGIPSQVESNDQSGDCRCIHRFPALGWKKCLGNSI